MNAIFRISPRAVTPRLFMSNILAPAVIKRWAATSGPTTSGNGVVVEVTDATFQSAVVDSSKPVLVDFYANWCGPCRMLTPLLTQAAEAAKGQFVLAKVNIDHCPDTSDKFRIEAVPTVLLMHKGKVVNSFVGVLPKPQLDAWLDSIKKLQ
ncbi:mitochondrial thioredoxin (TRX) family protein [Andalucia godoyi]|uniref:Mitochondrial thioredoxin (TRX) family protein n=1 Tax=Andalucia godoyi TaxID=505711 RepID=A0A8K0AI77_ANDGO|nr:mitochondrial thioredoxin (TRX) family protein [Andalucia godoyi]|eukprot:ANDGO_03814.mRNA.1 mitochondrial thioredoxin (TRX) family protein